MKGFLMYFGTGVMLYALFAFAADQLPDVDPRPCTCAGKTNCEAVVIPVDHGKRAFCAFSDCGDCCRILADSGEI